jgi:hypothetical protein
MMTAVDELVKAHGDRLRELLARDAPLFEQDARALGCTTLGQRLKLKNALLAPPPASCDDGPDLTLESNDDGLDLESNGDGGLDLESNGDDDGLALESNGDEGVSAPAAPSEAGDQPLDKGGPSAPAAAPGGVAGLLDDIDSDEEDEAGVHAAPPEPCEDAAARAGVTGESGETAFFGLRKKEPGYFDYDPSLECVSGSEDGDDDTAVGRLRREAGKLLEANAKLHGIDFDRPSTKMYSKGWADDDDGWAHTDDEGD